MATKVQKEWADIFFKENPHIKELYLNKQGEFFTDKNYVKNSLQKGKDGVLETFETIKRKEENLANANVKEDIVNNNTTTEDEE